MSQILGASAGSRHMDRQLPDLLSLFHEHPRESFNGQRLLSPLLRGRLVDGVPLRARSASTNMSSPLSERGYFRLCFKGGCLGSTTARGKSVVGDGLG